jgi:hypothetical protein
MSIVSKNGYIYLILSIFLNMPFVPVFYSALILRSFVSSCTAVKDGWCVRSGLEEEESGNIHNIVICSAVDRQFGWLFPI